MGHHQHWRSIQGLTPSLLMTYPASYRLLSPTNADTTDAMLPYNGWLQRHRNNRREANAMTTSASRQDTSEEDDNHDFGTLPSHVTYTPLYSVNC